MGEVKLFSGAKLPLEMHKVRVVQKLKWKEWGERFNHYLLTMEQLLWPDRIILGGGVSRQLAKFQPMLTTRAPVVAASLLNQAGLVGAALFAAEVES